MEEKRLQKYLAEAGVASRRKCEEYILQGKVEVNGKIITELGTKVTSNDVVKYNGRIIEPEEDEKGISVPESSNREKMDLIRLKADKAPDDVTDEEWEALIEDELTVKPLDIDNLCNAICLPFYKISDLLIRLQMSGRVVLENGKYALTFF